MLAFDQFDPKTGSDIWLHSKRDHPLKRLPRTRFVESGAVFSPDWNWIAYVSDESGQWDIYMQPEPGREGGKRKASPP